MANNQTFNTHFEPNVHLNDLEGMKQTGNLTNGNCQEKLNYSQNFVLKLSPNADLEKIVIETSKISDIGSDFLKQDDIGLKSYKTEWDNGNENSEQEKMFGLILKMDHL